MSSIPPSPITRPAAPSIAVRLAPGLDHRTLAGRVAAQPLPALLEGGPGLGPSGRWSLLAARPRLVLDSGDFPNDAAALDQLAALTHQYGLAQPDDPGVDDDPDAPPFRGGLIGSLSYDLAPSLERVPRRLPPDPGWPSLRFGLYDTFVAIDHLATPQVATLWAVDLLGEGAAAARRRLADWRAILDQPAPPRPRSQLSPVAPDRSRAEYRADVRRVLDYIAAGDIYQANLTHRFAATGRVDPFDLSRRLRERSPAPYASYLAWADRAIVGASPELFYATVGDRVVTRPIKGTRPRSADPVADARHVADLRASAKDAAELAMIVDLERNDLGRVCRFGSVAVVEPSVVESYAQVHHQVATVAGRLADGVGPVDVIRALFPGGSITGAPKIRAMEVIDELEANRRGPYTGAVGWLGRGGRSCFNIAIRTVLVAGDHISYQVGGGIVADSDPEAEYQETLDKARGMARVLASYRAEDSDR